MLIREIWFKLKENKIYITRKYILGKKRNTAPLEKNNGCKLLSHFLGGILFVSHVSWIVIVIC